MTLKKITVLSWFIKGYQLIIRPVLPCCCRFTPSCSEYATIAVERFGILAVPLILKRLWRCRPAHPGGKDLVPKQL